MLSFFELYSLRMERMVLLQTLWCGRQQDSVICIKQEVDLSVMEGDIQGCGLLQHCRKFNEINVVQNQIQTASLAHITLLFKELHSLCLIFTAHSFCHFSGVSKHFIIQSINQSCFYSETVTMLSFYLINIVLEYIPSKHFSNSCSCVYFLA